MADNCLLIRNSCAWNGNAKMLFELGSIDSSYTDFLTIWLYISILPFNVFIADSIQNSNHNHGLVDANFVNYEIWQINKCSVMSPSKIHCSLYDYSMILRISLLKKSMQVRI